MDRVDLVIAALGEDGVGVRLYVGLSSLPSLSCGPEENAIVVRADGQHLRAGDSCGFALYTSVDGVKCCCASAPLIAPRDGPSGNSRRRYY